MKTWKKRILKVCGILILAVALVLVLSETRVIIRPDLLCLPGTATDERIGDGVYSVGKNMHGWTAFKNPRKALRQFEEEYKDVLEEIQKQNDLAPFSDDNYKDYRIFGWQLYDVDDDMRHRGTLVTHFLGIYEHSYVSIIDTIFW